MAGLHELGAQLYLRRHLLEQAPTCMLTTPSLLMVTKITASLSLSESWWSGRVITRYDAQYTWVALEFDDGTVVVLSVEEVNVGKWFEVFPLEVMTSLPDYLSNYAFEWVELPDALCIFRMRSLWREEWQEPAQNSSQFLGSGPHSVQYVSPLYGVPSGTNVFEVEAGIELQGIDGRLLVICSSDNSPFKIDFAVEAGEVEQIKRFHTVQ